MDVITALSGRLDSAEIQAFESGTIISFKNQLNFPPPVSELTQRVETWPAIGWGLKNPTWDPSTRELHPKQLAHQPEAGEFIRFLDSFHQAAEKKLTQAIPHWKDSLIPDRVCWRPWELATRRVRWNARDDFFHIDHFPKRPSRGNRVVRVFMNAGRNDHIVWASTKPLNQLLEDGRRYGRPKVFSHLETIRREVTRKNNWWGWSDKEVSIHDAVYKTIHDRLKRDEVFQEETIRKIHHFPPGSIWMAMTDSCCHSFLRGSWMVDATWFLPAELCIRQDLVPARLLGTVPTTSQSKVDSLEKAA